MSDAWTPGRACACWCGLRWVRRYHQGWKHTDLIVLEMGLLGWGTGETERSKVDAPAYSAGVGPVVFQLNPPRGWGAARKSGGRGKE